MWYGLLGGKEIVSRTFRNLDQRVLLECDGQRIHLPSLQGIVVLNIPSYMGGANFWGGAKEKKVFLSLLKNLCKFFSFFIACFKKELVYTHGKM